MVTGKELNSSASVVRKPDGISYVEADVYRNSVSNGQQMLYFPLDSYAVPAGTEAGSVREFYASVDFRCKGPNSYCCLFGLFNSSGDNGEASDNNFVGIRWRKGDIQSLVRHNGTGKTGSLIGGDDEEGLYRLCFKVYNSGNETKMDVTLYQLDEITFNQPKVGEEKGITVLQEGESLDIGLDAFGLRNGWYDANDEWHAVYQLDNWYLSVEGWNEYNPVPSFADLCVSAVLENGSAEFDPWNQERWANWYNDGRLAHPFNIDCTVKLADRGGWSNAWQPDVSLLAQNGSNVYYKGCIFFIGTPGRGIRFNGNSQLIDTRSSDSRDIGDRDSCFYVTGSGSAVSKTEIKYVGIKGFRFGMKVKWRTHPVEIYHVNSWENDWGLYLGAENTVVNGGTLKRNVLGGIYLDSEAISNTVANVLFEDNNTKEVRWYGDVMADAAFLNAFSNNTHISTDSSTYDVAYKLYRNMGENQVLRERPAGKNRFEANSISGYDVAFEVACRMGGEAINFDLSDEGRDYAPNNLFKENSISNTAIGIKINSSGNIVDGNHFHSVDLPILLHCVWYSLTETRLVNQGDDKVAYWFANSDWQDDPDYGYWFHHNNDRNFGANPISERYIHVSYTNGTPAFDNYTGSATLLINDSQIVDLLTMKDVYQGAGTPLDVAAGDFWEESPGDEFAVIFDEPVSAVDGTNYYTIIIYDSEGIEVNRCGKSLTKWKAITAGDFFDVDYTGDDIAAVPDTAVDGKYPVYVFPRGYKDPAVIALTNNTKQIASLAAGNFKTDGDDYDEIAVAFSGGASNICFCKPTDLSWEIHSELGLPVMDIAAGHFDYTKTNGEEIAVAVTDDSRIYFFRPGETVDFKEAGPIGGNPWRAIGAGELNGNSQKDEVVAASAVSVDDCYPLYCYEPGKTVPVKTLKVDVAGIPAVSLDCGRPIIDCSLGKYDAVRGGWSSDDYAETVNGWGECVLYLPSAPNTEGCGIPAYWLNADPDDDSGLYLKVTPMVR